MTIDALFEDLRAYYTVLLAGSPGPYDLNFTIEDRRRLEVRVTLKAAAEHLPDFRERLLDVWAVTQAWLSVHPVNTSMRHDPVVNQVDATTLSTMIGLPSFTLDA